LSGVSLRAALAAIAVIGLSITALPAEAHGPRPPREPAIERRSAAIDTIALAERWLGSANPTGTAGPWCADFISFVFRRAGIRPLSGRMAASALSYGPRVAEPRRGDLAVMRTSRGPFGHVGLVVAEHGDWIEIISGNWARRVALAQISRRSVTAFVRV
jgi:uncharacterized protein (TIGR02594 family)